MSDIKLKMEMAVSALLVAITGMWRRQKIFPTLFSFSERFNFILQLSFQRFADPTGFL